MTSAQPGARSERPPHVRSRSSGQRSSQALQSAEDDAGTPNTEENWTSSSEEQDDSGVLEWTARRHKDDRKDDSSNAAPAAPAGLPRTSTQEGVRRSSDALPRRPLTPHGGGGNRASQSMAHVGSAPSPSVSSLRSSSSMVLGRHGLMPRTPSAPKPQLDTHKVFMDRHDVATDSAQPEGAAGQSEGRFYVPQDDEAGTPTRPSRSTSTDNLVGHPAALGRRRLDSVSSLSNIASVARPQAQRTMSTQSLADVSSAARRQPPRSSRQYLDELLGREPVVGTNTPPGGMSAVLQAGRFVDRPSKPVASKFASYQHQFDTGAASATPQRLWAPHLSDMPSRIVSVEVPPGSVFSPGFVDRVRHRIEQDRAGSLRRGETGGHEEPPSPDTAPSGEPRYRYLLDYALSGPPIDPVAVQDVDLAPHPAASMNPSHQQGLVSWGSEGQLASLSEAARSRTRLASSLSSSTSSGGEGAGSGRRALTHWRSKALVQDSSTTLGPNMIPFHFIHALTSAMDNALALDHTEVPAMAALLPGVPEHGEGEELAEAAGERSEDECLLLIDNPSMRAIACTVQAVSVQRQHTVTRRFSDPMRAALERVADAGGYKAHLPHASPRRSTPRRPLASVRSRLPRADSS